MLDKKKFYINGQWVAPKNSREIQVIDPATEKNCAVISLGNADDVNAAVIAAKKAFESWGFSSKEEKPFSTSGGISNSGFWNIFCSDSVIIRRKSLIHET